MVAQGNHKVDEKDQSKCVTSAWVDAGERLIRHLEVENLKTILKKEENNYPLLRPHPGRSASGGESEGRYIRVTWADCFDLPRSSAILSQSVSRLRLRREHLRRTCEDAVRARRRGRGPRPPSASGAGEHRRLAGGRVQTAAGGDCTGSGCLSVRRVRGCGGRRHIAPLAARPGLGCRRRAVRLARCGRGQGAAGETVTFVLSGDGASGRFQSSSERPERGLG